MYFKWSHISLPSNIPLGLLLWRELQTLQQLGKTSAYSGGCFSGYLCLSYEPLLKKHSMCMAFHRNESLIDKRRYREYGTVLFQDTQKVWWAPCSCWYLMHAVQCLKQPEVRLSHLPSVFLRDIKHSRAIFPESYVKGLMSYWSSTLPQPGSSPPEALQSVWLASQIPAFSRLFRAGNSYCFG